MKFSDLGEHQDAFIQWYWINYNPTYDVQAHFENGYANLREYVEIWKTSMKEDIEFLQKTLAGIEAI